MVNQEAQAIQQGDAVRPRATVPSRERLLLLSLLLLALFIRVHQIDIAPPGVSGDEIFNGIDANRIGRGYWPVFMEGNNGREALYFYLLAPMLHLLGQSVFALRLPAVIIGALAVLVAYLVGRELFGRRVGGLAAALIAVSLWPIILSRYGLRAGSLTLLATLSVYFFAWGLRRGRWRDWLAAGMALGLTMYTYIPSRAFPAVIAGWLVCHWLWRRDALQRHGRGLALALLLALLVFAPYGLYILRYPQKVNQRISTLTTAWEQARAGNPSALVESVRGTLGMFTVAGDEDWRYHVSGEPVFDPLTGLFFYLGLALSAWWLWRPGKERHRRPSYALLLIWLAAMLGPNAILEPNPGFLRAAGAIAPIYLLAAVGLDAVYRRLRQWWPAARLAFPALVALGLCLTLARSWRLYFEVWNNAPQVRVIYQAELAAFGRFLAQQPPPAGTRVFVAYSYVLDNTTSYALSLYSNQPVTWFDRQGSFPWPASPPSESWYLVPVTHSLPAAALALLARGEAQTVSYTDAAPSFTFHRLPPGPLIWSPQHDLRQRFADAPHLVGYDLPGTLYRGDQAPLTLHWEIPAGLPALPNQLLFIKAWLEDVGGSEWAGQSALLGYPQAGWVVGDRFAQQMSLAVPPGMPPGPVRLNVAMHTANGHALTLLDAPATSQPVVVRSRPHAAYAVSPAAAVFDGTLVLEKATFSSLLAPGLPTDFALDWVSLRPPPMNYRLRLQLRRPGEAAPFLSQTFMLWPGVYPPVEWHANEPVTTFHRFNIPLDLPTDANPELWAELLPATGDTPLPLTQGQNKLADMTLSLRQRLFTPPPIAQPLAARFGGEVALLGYDLDPSEAHAGGRLLLTLYWQALKAPADNYTVFNHLAGADGQLYGQFDSPPVGEGWLMTTWLPGEVVVEQREIPIRAGAPPGRYTLLVGLYTPHDVRRLPVTLDGRPQHGDQLILADVEVE